MADQRALDSPWDILIGPPGTIPTVSAKDQILHSTGIEQMDVLNSRATLNFTTKVGVVLPRYSEILYLDESGTAIFGGMILSRGLRGIGNEQTRQYVVDNQCVDHSAQLDDVYVSLDYLTIPSRITVGQLAQDLQTNYFSTFSPPFVLDPGQIAGPELEPFVWINVKASDAIRQVTTKTSLVLHVSPSRVWKLYLPGTDDAPHTLNNADPHVEVRWQDPSERRKTFLHGIFGGAGKGPGHIDFVSDGVQLEYDVVYPVSQDINDQYPNLLYIDGVLIEPISWYDQLGPGHWQWHANLHKLINTSGTPLAAGQVVTVDFTKQFPFFREANSGLLPRAEDLREYPTITTIEEADQVLAQELLTLNQDPRDLQVTDLRPGWRTGQKVDVDLALRRSVQSQFIVKSIRTSKTETQWKRTIAATETLNFQGSVMDKWRRLLGMGGGPVSSNSGSTGVENPPGNGGGEGAEEVFVGATDPGPALELWYDTDEPAPENTIPDHSVPLVKLQEIASQTVLGRSAPGTGIIEILTVLPIAVQDSITHLGTITAGVWRGSPIPLTYIAGAGIDGTFVRSNGTNWAVSTLILPNTVPVNSVIYATAPNVYGSSPNLTFTGSALALVGNQTLTGFIGSATYASQTTGWRIDGAGGADFRYMFVDEMHAKSFITDLEMALAGGQIISKSVAMVAVPFTVPGGGAVSTLQVRDLPSMADVACFEPGDTVVLRRFSRTAGALNIVDCIGRVSGYVDQPDGTQTWLFTRNTGAAGGSMSGGVVSVDSLALDYGVSGNGYYEVNAIDGAYGSNSPYAQVVTWTTAPTGANKVVRTRFGKLTGITGVANEFGMIAGTYAASNGSYFRASNTMFELHNITASWWAGFAPVVVISPGGGSPYLSLGNPAYSAPGMGPGIVLSYNQSLSRASLWCYAAGNNYLVFDGSVLYWRAANTILDTAGNLTATSASLSGAITATSGLVTGDFVIGTGGQMRSGAAGYAAGIGWWLDYNGGSPRFRIGNPNADRMSWDGATLTVRSGKLLIDGSANGHIGMGAAPYSIATLNIASDTDDANSYGLLVTNHSGTVPTLLTYGDGRLFLGGQLYIMPGAWDTTGQGTNPPSIWNGPFGNKELSGWMRIFMYVGGGGGIPPTGPYSRGWVPVWLG